MFAGARHPRSRLVLVEGASHFSPVRIESRGEALFQLGEELVGIAPLKVQALLLNLTTEFLQGMEQPSMLSRVSVGFGSKRQATGRRQNKACGELDLVPIAAHTEDT